MFNFFFFIEEFFFYLNLSMYLLKKIVYIIDNFGLIFFSKKKIELRLFVVYIIFFDRYIFKFR